MIQSRPDKILFALASRMSARFCFQGAHTPQNESYQLRYGSPLINLVSLLCFVDVGFAQGITPLKDLASSLKFASPSFKRTCRAVLTPFVMTQPRPDKILSAFGLNKTRTILFIGLSYTSKCILPIKVWITPYKLNISLVLCQCKIYLECYIVFP